MVDTSTLAGIRAASAAPAAVNNTAPPPRSVDTSTLEGVMRASAAPAAVHDTVLPPKTSVDTSSIDGIWQASGYDPATKPIVTQSQTIAQSPTTTEVLAAQPNLSASPYVNPTLQVSGATTTVEAAENRLLKLSEREREHLINPGTGQAFTDNDITQGMINALERKREDAVAVEASLPPHLIGARSDIFRQISDIETQIDALSPESAPAPPIGTKRTFTSIRAVEAAAAKQRDNVQDLADDIDALGSNMGAVTEVMRQELLQKIYQMEGDIELAWNVRQNMEDGLSLGEARVKARSALSTAPEPVPNPGPVQPPIDGQLGATNLGSVLPKFSNVIDGTHGTSADAALGILENVSAGRPAFNPELGTKGPVQWFVTEGIPRTGGGTADVTLPVDIDVPRGADVLEFNDAQLKEIYDKHLAEATELATEQYAERYPDRNLNSNRSVRKIEFNARNIAELDMWAEVGNRVAASEDGIGRVVQTANSQFSQGRPGHFMLTSNPEVARVTGGAEALLDIINTNGIKAEPAVVEAAEQAARNGTINGRVQGVFRVGGRVLVVAGAAADGYRIYQADDKIREGVIVGGGWAGAGTAIGAYNLATGPTNAAGPVAWGFNALGNIGAGFAGYFAGEKIAEYVYDLVIDPNPLEVPAG